MTSTWTPPPGPPPVIPGPGMTPPHKPNGSKRGLIAFSAVAGLAVVIAATATITYSVTRPSAPAAHPTGALATGNASPEQQAAAKKRLCDVFDAGTKGQAGKGGARAEGQLNIPVVLRMMNSGAAVNSALTPEVPADVAQAAREYVARVFDLTTEALGEGDVERGNQLNTATNNAIDSLMDACGLPR